MDRRIRGCSNIYCDNYKNHKKFKADEAFCTKCGSPTVFVCAKCFTEIEDIDPKHRLCLNCEAQQSQRLEKVKDTVENVAQKGGEFVLGLGVTAFAALKAVANKEVANRVKGIAEKVIRH